MKEEEEEDMLEVMLAVVVDMEAEKVIVDTDKMDSSSK